MLGQLLRFISELSQEAWEGLTKAAAMAFVLAICALAMMFKAQAAGLSPEQLHIARALSEAPAGIFLIAALGVVLIESRGH